MNAPPGLRFTRRASREERSEAIMSAPFTAIALIYGNVEPQFERQRICVALNSLGKLL
jgi:hypothetical protein